MTSIVLPNGANAKLVVPRPFTLSMTVPQSTNFLVIPARGPRGLQGLSGEGTQIFGEEPTGAKDGVNTIFTLPNTYRTGTVVLHLNGLREKYFTETGPDTIELEDPPTSTDDLLVDYIVL